MEIKTFKAKTMRDALELVRRELGPEASVLHTREVHGGPIGRLVFGRRYEVAASATVQVPSRLPAMAASAGGVSLELGGMGSNERTLPRPLPIREGSAAVEFEEDYRARYRDDF